MSVTVVLPTDRPTAHQARWLRHARRTAFPFPVVAATTSAGGITPEASLDAPQVLLVAVAGRIWAQDALACLDAVKTPYALLGDPGDFVVANGLARVVRFLHLHPDYICAGGLSVCYQGLGPPPAATSELPFAAAGTWRQPAALWEAPTPAGTGLPEVWWAAFRPMDLDQVTAERRIAAFGSNFRPLYGFVFRTPVLRQILNELTAAQTGSELLFEVALAWQAALRGRMHLLAKAVCLVAPARRFEHYRDCRIAYEHFFDPPAMDSFHTVTRRLGDQLTEFGSEEAAQGLVKRLAMLLAGWHSRIVGGPGARAGHARTAAKAHAVPAAAVLATEPQRYLESDGENRIRATMGNFVAQLSRAEIGVAPRPSTDPFGFLVDQLAAFGAGDAEIEAMIADVLVIREALVAA